MYKLLRLATVVAFVAAAWFVFLLVAGYGNLEISVPKDVSVQINGHPMTATKIKLRSGRYYVLAISPKYRFDYSQIKVPLLGTAKYKPDLKPQDPTSILTSTIVTDGSYGRPGFLAYKWFSNDTWIAGQLNISGNFIALHYQHEAWNVAYYQAGGNYPHSISKLPANVASYIKSGEAAYARQQH